MRTPPSLQGTANEVEPITAAFAIMGRIVPDVVTAMAFLPMVCSLFLQVRSPCHQAQPIHMTAGTRFMPPSFLNARGTWPRPRCDCPGCGGELSLAWGSQRGPYLRHVRSANETKGCTGGESIQHMWAKESLAGVLRQQCSSVGFERTCPACLTTRYLGAFDTCLVSPKPNYQVKTEYRLTSGRVADIAVTRSDHIIGIVEIFHTHRTATTQDDDGTAGRPEPWFEVESATVFRMINRMMNSSGPTHDGAALPGRERLECVRQDMQKCGRCCEMSDTWTAGRQLKLSMGKHKGSTFEQVFHHHPKYWRWALEKLISPTFIQLGFEAVFFEKPNAKWVDARLAFLDANELFLVPRSGQYEGSILHFCNWIMNDPDLRGIEIKNIARSNIDWSLYDEDNPPDPWDIKENQYQIPRARLRYRSQTSKHDVTVSVSCLEMTALQQGDPCARLMAVQKCAIVNDSQL